MQRDDDPWRELRGHFFLVEGNDLDAGSRKILGKESAAGAEAVVGIRNREVDLLYADLKSVARLGGLDEYRAGEDMATGAFVGDLLVDITQGLLHVRGRNSGAFQPLG